MRSWKGHLREMMVFHKVGSRAMVVQFLHRYGEAVERAACGRLLNGSNRDAELEDVWQAGLAKLMQHAPTLRKLGLNRSLAAYICNTFKNLHRDWARRSSLPAHPKASIEECQPLPAPSRDDPLCNAVVHEYIDTIRQRAPTHRGYRALLLAYNGMDVREIAPLFGVTEKHLRRIMGTAVRDLFGSQSDE